MTDMAQTATLRILFLSSNPLWDDGARWLVAAAAGLANRGDDVLVAAPRATRLLDRARGAGVASRTVRLGRGIDPAAVLSVRRILHECRPHAVFLDHDDDLRSLCLATLGSRPPVVFLRDDATAPDTAGWVRRWAHTRCVTRLLTGANTTPRPAAPPVPQHQVRVLRDGVAIGVPLTASERAALRRQLRLPRRQRLIVHAGELRSDQGQASTLDALAQLREQSADPKRDVPSVAFVGAGPDESRLRDRCHALGVQDHVLWLGFRSNTDQYLAAADVCVLPSRVAATSRTVLEAWAQRTPVVAARTGGVAGWIEDGVHGLLVAPEDATALAAALHRLLTDDDLARRLSEAGVRQVEAHWSADALLDDLECLILAELVRRRAPTGRGANAARIASRAALFVDRDGTLVHNVPYNGDPAAVELVADAARALRWVRDAAIPTIVITNQSGIAQGLHTDADVLAVHARIRELLRQHGADADALYYCPHHPDHGPACDCRKPQPGLLVRAIHEHGLAPGDSLMVGDAQRDLDAAHAAGVPAAGLAAAAGDPAFAARETVYTQWTALVRDFLRARWLQVRFDVPHADAKTSAAPFARQSRPVAPTTRSE